MKSYRLTPILLFIVVICSSFIKTGNIQIEGVISNRTFDKITIQNLANEDVVSAVVDEKGSFAFDTRLESGYYSINYGRSSSYVYFYPMDDLIIRFDANNFFSTLQFEGAGADRNNYLVQKQLLKDKMTKDVNAYYIVTEQQYKANLDELNKSLANLLNSYAINDFFKQDELKALRYEYLYGVQNFQYLHEYYSGDKIEVSSSFLQSLKKIDYTDLTDYSKMPYCKYFIDGHWSKRIDAEDTYDDMLAEYQRIKSRELRVSMLISFYSKVSSSKDKGHLYLELIQKNVQNKDFVKAAEAEYTAANQLGVGDLAPDFTYVDYYENSITLSSFRGKWVFIDVWATWCAPCIKQQPYLQDLEKQFHGQNIEFVSISVDKQSAMTSWKNMVKDKSLSGVQLFSDNSFDSEFIDALGVNSIPRFIIIDPEGKIYDKDAPSPSFEKTKALLVNLLK